MKKILIIEDDKQLIKSLTKIFKFLKFEVVSFSNILDAIESLVDNAPDLIVSDYYFKNFTAIDLLSRLNGLKEKVRVPVIILSGTIDEEVQELCLKHGASAFLSKPFRINELKEIISSLNIGE